MTKKFNIALLMIAAMMVAVVLSGCSDTDLIEEVVLEEMPIDFSSTTNKNTRAAITNNKDLADAGGFYVWGWKTKTEGLSWASGNPYQVFNGVNVYSNGNDGAYDASAATNWTYDVKKYWDAKCTYCFYAAGPVNTAEHPTAGTISLVDKGDVDQKVFQITDIESLSTDDTRYNDFVIDRTLAGEGVKKQAKTDNVDFQFRHVMSKVKVALVTEVPNATITVTDIKMSGWDNAKYDFEQNPAFDDTNSASYRTDTWKRQGDKVTGEAVFLQNGSVQLNEANGSEKFGNVSTSYIMVPQKISKLIFTMSYRIDYSDGTYDTFDNVTATLQKEMTWSGDCVTTYTLRIQPKEIKFNVSVAGWSESGTYTVVIQ